MAKLIKTSLEFFRVQNLPRNGHHELEAVELINLARARVAVNRHDVHVVEALA